VKSPYFRLKVPKIRVKVSVRDPIGVLVGVKIM
jgi:hypothetical protein